jgi:hypothetical protein
MGTDAVKLARVDWRVLSASEALHRERLLFGQPDPSALYVLSDAYADLAGAAHSDPQDVLVRANGLNVLAPSWGRTPPPGVVAIRPARGRFQLPFSTDFATDSAGRLLLGEGWYADEDGVRTTEGEATLFVPGDAPSLSLEVTLVLKGSGGEKPPPVIEVYAPVTRVATTVPSEHSPHRLSFRVPPIAGEHHFRRIVLRFGSSRRPTGRREPEIELERLEVRAATEHGDGTPAR